MLDTILTTLGLTKAGVITGAVGAALAALRNDNSSWWQRILNFTIGFFLAAWGAGVAANVFGLPDTPTFHGALGFTIGYLGKTIADAATEAISALKTIDVKGIIEGWIKK